MKKKLAWFSLLIMVCDFAALHAQSTNRASLNYQQLGKSDGVSTSDFAASLNHRFFLDDDGANLLTVGLGFSEVFLEDDTLTGSDRERNLRALVPSINLMKILSEEYSLIVTARPGFYGDLNGSLSDEFRLEGGAVVTKVISSNLTLGLGLGRGSNFGRDLVVPLIQFLYFASDKIIVQGLLPLRASVWYVPSQQWEFGAVFRLQGSLYDIDESSIPGAQQVGFGAAHVGVAGRYKLFGQNFLSAELGITAVRRYQWADEKEVSFDIGEDPFQERELDPVPYLNVGWLQKF